LNATKDATLPPDGYRLQIRSDGIEMSFGGETGAHYAGITLLMLRFTHDESLPCGTIEDQPRFEWRGQHLDCARHFYATATIEKLLDLMALLKLNRFHWHFSDDEAFRLEIESAPELWQTTRLRGEGHLVPGVFGGGASAGGSYSKADALNLIAHAKGYHIEIMPEIEFPAHALGFARAYPETRDPDDIGTEVSVQGYAENVLNPALPETWSRIEAIAEEVGALFPFSMLHLGADELPDGTWSGSPSVAALKAEQGLETRDDVLGWALSQLAEKLSKAGIRSAAWEEAARGCTGGIGNNALLFSWTGQAPGIEAARAGYDIVMCPAQHVYLDMAHTSAPEDWGAAWAAFVSLRDTLNWNVIPEPDIADRVVGVEGTFWSEFTTSDHEIEPMIAPRLFGVASKAWCVAETVSEETFQSSSRRLCDLLTVMGWKWNSNCF
jgi:hexosaminidase